MYSVLIFLVLPFSILNFLFRKLLRKHPPGKQQLNRFGLGFSDQQQGGLLVHCVSVGEVVAAANLIKCLQNQQPGTPIYITTTTPTGADRVKQIFSDSVTHYYLPFDAPFCMTRMLAKLKPTKVLITEVELWPNLIHACWKRHAPVYVINARMTDRSTASYAKIGRLFQPMLSKLTGVCAQGKRDYDNYLKLGMAPEKLYLSNNIKFDLSPTDSSQSAQLADTLNLVDRRLLVAGSTHEGEESYFIDAYRQLKKQFPELLLVLVPRHPQRFERVFQLCAQANLSTLRFSQENACEVGTEIILVDAMGKLDLFYALGELAFVGGSIADRGGHNALEPAAKGVPILMGPHRYNNPIICQTLEHAGALKMVNTVEEIVNHCSLWFADNQARSNAGSAGLKVISDNRGAVAATLNIINPPA